MSGVSLICNKWSRIFRVVSVRERLGGGGQNRRPGRECVSSTVQSHRCSIPPFLLVCRISPVVNPKQKIKFNLFFPYTPGWVDS